MNLNYLPDIIALAIFILAFHPFVRRVGAHVNLWFLGWSFVLMHDVVLMFAGPRHRIFALLGLWALDLCGVSFVMVSSNVPMRRIGRRLALLLGVPALFQATLAVYQIDGPVLHGVACLLFLLPAGDMLIEKKPRDTSSDAIRIAFALLGELMLLPAVWRNGGLVADCVLSLLFLSSAYLYTVSTVRFTRGVIVAIAGLVSWGLSWPVVRALGHLWPQVRIYPAMIKMPHYLVMVGIVLTLLEEHVLRTERMAMHDPLTDLPNRRLFEERVVAAMEEARLQCTTVACLVIDVDNFKAVNDTLGHGAGDQLLQALSARLSWHMSPRDILARTGGDEFTALLAGVNDEHHLRFVAGAMMSAASVPIAIDGESVEVRISVGVALSPDHADDLESLRRAADEAMYTAKRRGGSQLVFTGESAGVSASVSAAGTMLRSRASLSLFENP